MFSKPRSGMLMAAMLGVFAVMATAAIVAAPAARADDPYTDLVNAVQGDFSLAQEALTLANADFGAGDVSNGLAEFYSGIDSDLLSVPDNLLQGSIAALTDVPVESAISWDLPVTDFGDASIIASTIALVGEGDFATAASDFASGDVGDALEASVQGVQYLDVIVPEVLIIAGADSLGL